MNGITSLFDSVLKFAEGVSFDVWVTVDLCAFVAVFVATVLACAFSEKVRRAEKKAFFHLVNLFTAVTLALFCTKYKAEQALIAACGFWIVGYLLYGLLCVLFKKRQSEERVVGKPLPVLVREPFRAENAAVAPAANSGVRLEHALSIADKLLLKTLGRGDRQELEKIKTALTVLKVKGELSPQDGEALNEMFNALLKLMAKYDL